MTYSGKKIKGKIGEENREIGGAHHSPPPIPTLPRRQQHIKVTPQM